jgi:hypothetical protein
LNFKNKKKKEGAKCRCQWELTSDIFFTDLGCGPSWDTKSLKLSLKNGKTGR